MKLYAGIDLHSNNSYVVILNEEGKVLYKKRLPNDMSLILSELSSYQQEMKGIVVESTYNWYWLVDGLEEAGYQVHLANTTETSKYGTDKHMNDYKDAKLLAELLMHGLLKEGHIYPKEKRVVRELSRRRIRMVQQRTMLLVGIQSLITRYTGRRIKSDDIKALTEEEIKEILTSEDLRVLAEGQVNLIGHFTDEIQVLEKQLLKYLKQDDGFKRLKTIPGIGQVLAMTILLETGDIKRFSRANNYCSYCRCVKSEKESNGKKKGSNNRKNGNAYLAWAFMEGAHFAIRYEKQIKRFYDRKTSRTHRIVALKTIAAKLSKASYMILSKEVDFELTKLFI